MGALAGFLLVRRELHRPFPLVPFDLLRNRVFGLSIATSIASFTAQMLAFVALPFHFEGLLHRSEVETGLLLTPWPVAVAIAAPLAGRLADRLPAALLGGAGLIVFAGGLALLAAMPADVSNLDIIWRMAVCGLGFGFFQSPNNRLMLSTAPRERAGAAGGMLATARLTGQTAGAVIFAILLEFMGGRGERIALAAAAAIALLAAAVGLMRMARAPAPRHPDPEVESCET